MPTNLPPEALNAERRYREAGSIADKIASLEEYLGLIPKHKGTDHLRADLRKKLSRLKDGAQTRKGSGRRDSAFQVDREGAGQVVLAGTTNVGKSALVAALTNATPEVSEAPFTTWAPTPGMMPIDDIQVQLIDTPPLNREYVDRELFHLIRRADLVLLVVDVQTSPIQQLEEAIAMLRENRIVPHHLQDQHRADEGERITFVPLLVLANKTDDERTDEVFDIFCELIEGDWPLIPVSARTGRNVAQLKQAVFEQLDIVRVYSKAPGKPPDLTAPFVMKRGSTVKELAGKVHQDFYRNLKTARVWGSAERDGQMVGRDHVLQDGDVVELRT